MSGVNKAILLGYVGKDPKITEMKNGELMASFSLATSEKWTDKRTGDAKDSTQWHYVACYRKLAEIVSDYVKGGERLYVEGKIDYSEYEDKQGVNQKVTKIIASSLQMLTTKAEKGERAGQPSSGDDYKKAKAGNDAPVDEGFDLDDSIPF